MYYQLSRLGMCVVKQKGFSSRMTGSSKFLCRDYHIFDKSFVIKENATEQNFLLLLREKKFRILFRIFGLKSYLWVAERQKNGTLHFHLITHNIV